MCTFHHLKFPFLKKTRLFKVYFLFVSICGKKTVFCVIRNNLKVTFCELTSNINLKTIVNKLFLKKNHCCCFVQIIM